MLHDFISLFYPSVCAACGNSLYKHESVICNKCYISLPQSNYHKNPNNPLATVLKGRFPFVEASAFYLFKKGSRVQKLLHQLKYKNRPDIGVLIGEWMAEGMKDSEFAKADMILPIPLHPKRQLKRGYNQSTQLANGMGNKLLIPVLEDVLYRKAATKTQTKKGKSDRWDNVEEIFDVYPTANLEGKKIILIDDVITTGSTIEACANAIHKHKNVQLYILSMAFAEL